jgi:hypothetical protein
METHVKALGVLWIIYGVIGLLFILFLFATLFGVSYIPDMGNEATVILRTVAIGFCIFLSVLTLPELIAGFGVLNYKEWGRIVALAVAFFNLLAFPFGTALSVYTLVILFNSEAIQLFKKT